METAVGSTAPLPFAIARLIDVIHGVPLDQLHAEHDTARKIWKGMIDRRPTLVARCVLVEAVQAAMAFARAEGLPVAVCTGGGTTCGQFDAATQSHGLVSNSDRPAPPGDRDGWRVHRRADRKHPVAWTMESCRRQSSRTLFVL